MKKKIAFLTAAVLLFACLSAGTLAALDVDISNSVVLQISTLPEAKISFTQGYRIPFMQFDNPFMADNNINLSWSAEVSPVSVNGVVTAVWTPLAFLTFTLGGRIGTGWNIRLFGSDLYGIGLNESDGGISTNFSEYPDGLLWAVKAGATFQFDLAAIFPGDWNHVVFQTYHEVNYKGYSKANAFEPWFYEVDSGENINGFNYYGSYVLGYQMPASPILKMVAFMAESDLYLYDNPPGYNRKSWGDDLIRWTFSGILDFSITEQFGVTLITQLRTMRRYSNFTYDKNDPSYVNMYYRNRLIYPENQLSLEFFRVAAILTFKL